MLCDLKSGERLRRLASAAAPRQGRSNDLPPARPPVPRNGPVTVGALLAEQTDEWAVTRRYMTAETLGKQRHHDTSPTDPRPSMAAIAR